MSTRLGDGSKYLGSGMAQKAAEATKKRKKRVKRRMTNVMDELQKGRGSKKK